MNQSCMRIPQISLPHLRSPHAATGWSVFQSVYLRNHHSVFFGEKRYRIVFVLSIYYPVAVISFFVAVVILCVGILMGSTVATYRTTHDRGFSRAKPRLASLFLPAR